MKKKHGKKVNVVHKRDRDKERQRDRERQRKIHIKPFYLKVKALKQCSKFCAARGNVAKLITGMQD